MIYCCADDYGISSGSCRHIEECVQNGVINRLSVVPNGEAGDFVSRFDYQPVVLSLHLNLVEGHCLSDPKKIPLLVDEDGNFKYSFLGLFRLSLSARRKELAEQIAEEINRQIQWFQKSVGIDAPLHLDSHQHTHMIPLVMRTLLRVIDDGKWQVAYLRIPAEPLGPYLKTPSLYLTYRPVNLVKQWVLKWFSYLTRKDREKAKIPAAYYMGVLFSGDMDTKRVAKVLVHYKTLAKKHKKNIELGFHPGYLEPGDELIAGNRSGFLKFYQSPGRKTEFQSVMDLTTYIKTEKEGD